MSLILQKYKSKKKLGKGAYGDVLLVEDPDGRELAIKMISKRIIQKDPYLEEYLDGEKEVMMSVKSKYIMELYAFEEDDNYKYFICEYCDGGDLLNAQAKQPNKVYDLKSATRILSEVIHGLELLHSKGYLHRDIKPQNILLKKSEQEGHYLYKLADFGFAKKNEDVGGTVLGTENYMSPEIYSNEVYSYEVDMWAFGVLFYFMLNMEYPFKISTRAEPDEKQRELTKQATNFSYKDRVAGSKKRLMDNCNPDVEDLFAKIFDPNAARRINFVEIREHPVFREYFPVISGESRILYKSKKPNRYDTFIQNKLSTIVPKNKPVKPEAKDEPQDVAPYFHVQESTSTKEKEVLNSELGRILFLDEVDNQLGRELNFVDPAMFLAFKYNLTKYYIILLRNFYHSLKQETLEARHPKLGWKGFCKTPEFSKFKSETRQKLDSAEMSFSQCYMKCRELLSRIKQANPKFETCLEGEVTSKEMQGDFKNSYRTSTNQIFKVVRERFSNGNRYVYLTALVVICHGFNQIIQSSEQELRQIFAPFVGEAVLLPERALDLGEMRSWMSKSNKETIKVVIKNMLKSFNF